LDYKRKEQKKRKEESESSTESEEVKEKSRNMQVWKKSMGVIGKVFIIKGKYTDLREALLERGWVENTDKKSNFYDLKWTSKISDINFATLSPNQMVNHFDNNSCLTSKYGLLKSVRSVMYP
jgi:tubulin monoglycylase TTLL3/8